MRWRRVAVVVIVMGGLFAGLALLLKPVLLGPSTKQTVLGSRIDWPQVSYAEVRGFFYNAEGDGFVPIIEEGKLHKSVVNPDGVLLNASQVERLLDAVARPHSDFAFRVACYDPRHAFVFFDEERNPVAYFEICFSCVGERASPSLPHRVSHAELQQLCQELSLPVFWGRNDRQRYLDYAARTEVRNSSGNDSEPSTSKAADR